MSSSIPRNRFGWITLAALLVGVPAAMGQQLDVSEQDVEAGYSSNHVIVKLLPGVESATLDDGRPTITGPRRRGARQAPESFAVADMLQQFGASSVRRAHRGAQNIALAESIGLDRYVRVEVPAGTDTKLFVERLNRYRDLVEFAEVDGVGGLAAVPDDQWFSTHQYGLNNTGQVIEGSPGDLGADISAVAAWDFTTGSPDTIVGILDAGVNPHTDLAGRLLPGIHMPCLNSEVPCDETFTGDVCFSHGTHVAGIACATGNNSTGVAGVNWQAMILPVTVVPNCNGVEADLADGITWAVDHGADVLNMSLQYAQGTQYLHDAVTYAWESGVIMVAAAGNNGFSANGTTAVAYPGRWPETIAVAATNNRDLRPSFSNWGPELDVAAPGDDIWSSINFGNYGFKFGTSMATPHVTGLVSLMLAMDPTLTNDEVRQILRTSADDVQAVGFDEFSGYGRINALSAILTIIVNERIPGDVNDDDVVNVDDLIAAFLAWGPCPVESPCDGDLDGDGQTNVDDLITIILNWS